METLRIGVAMILYKHCTKCKLEKPIQEFGKDKYMEGGISRRCKECKRIISAKSRENNPYQSKEYYAKNKEKYSLYGKARREKNPLYMKEYYKKNAKRITKHNNNYEKEKIKTDPEFKLQKRIRARIRIHLNKMKINKPLGVSAIGNIGCDMTTLRRYFEERFGPGMTWDNMGSYWVIDHIWPLSTFNLANRDEFMAAIHYTNLQPLTKTRNIQKGNRV